MKVVEKMLFRPVNRWKMVEETIKLENELIEQGYDVQPRGGPVVILKLDGGEVHYVPHDDGIWQYIFEYQTEGGANDE